KQLPPKDWVTGYPSVWSGREEKNKEGPGAAQAVYRIDFGSQTENITNQRCVKMSDNLRRIL
ncbi:hypothetical protein JMJ77_0009711, partial [Colletotrichum scovillei]